MIKMARGEHEQKERGRTSSKQISDGVGDTDPNTTTATVEMNNIISSSGPLKLPPHKRTTASTTVIAENDMADNTNDGNDGLDIPNKKGERMEMFIFKEFRRLRSMKRLLLQKAERAHRLAQREVKYWYSQKVTYDRKQKKKRFIDDYVQSYYMQQQRCNTKREIVQAMDLKMPMITQAIKKYDQSILVRSIQSTTIILSH
jgi:hypothetical protein